LQAGINIRPYAIETLKELSEFYELVVFTASHSNYADVVIDLLDPNRTIFAKRLFRENCIHTDNGLYIKDLRVLGCDLKSTIIVDNAIISFAFQLDNGIPIIPFYDDKDDKILPKIKDYLLSLKDLEDVRTINRKTFSLTELCKLNIPSFLKYYYEDENENDVSNDSVDSPVDVMEESPRTHALRSKSVSFLSGSGIGFKIRLGRRMMAVVEDQLGKLRATLPKYLANEEKSTFSSESKT